MQNIFTLALERKAVYKSYGICYTHIAIMQTVHANGILYRAACAIVWAFFCLH